MASAIIEITKIDGKPKYAITKSGDADIDKLAEVAIGTMGTFLKAGGNPQNILAQLAPMLGQMGGAGGGIQNLLGNMMGGMR